MARLLQIDGQDVIDEGHTSIRNDYEYGTPEYRIVEQVAEMTATPQFGANLLTRVAAELIAQSEVD